MQLACCSWATVTPVVRLSENKVSPTWTVYHTQFRGGTQLVGEGKTVKEGVIVGVREGVRVRGDLVAGTFSKMPESKKVVSSVPIKEKGVKVGKGCVGMRVEVNIGTGEATRVAQLAAKT